MKSFMLHIYTSNAAFDDEDNPLASREEIARILRGLANSLEFEPASSGYLYDINGNRVGDFTLDA